ncbi:hypothetical protein UT300012_31640 [Paraclostridium bifermentans]|mgnify:CR=1 FL=1
MCNYSKENLIYNKKIGELELHLVAEKILPTQLSSYHGHIMVNIEAVDFDIDEEYQQGIQLLKETYKKLSRDSRFENRMIYHDDVDEIELLG